MCMLATIKTQPLVAKNSCTKYPMGKAKVDSSIKELLTLWPQRLLSRDCRKQYIDIWSASKFHNTSSYCHFHKNEWIHIEKLSCNSVMCKMGNPQIQSKITETISKCATTTSFRNIFPPCHILHDHHKIPPHQSRWYDLRGYDTQNVHQKSLNTQNHPSLMILNSSPPQ